MFVGLGKYATIVLNIVIKIIAEPDLLENQNISKDSKNRK
jgi:hypothetical protein